MMKKLVTITLSFLAFANIILGQQKLDPTLEVKRDFDGKLIEIHKSRLNTIIDDTLTRFNLDFNYSIFNKPYRDMYEFNPLPSLQIEQNTYPEQTKLYIKASAGYPFNPKGEIFYQPFVSKKNSINNIVVLSANIDAFIGDMNVIKYNFLDNVYEKTNDKNKANNSNWGLGFLYKHLWNKGELSTRIKYNGFRNSYYGYNANFMLDSPFIYNTTNALGFYFDINSIDAKTKGTKFNYNFYLDYNYVNSNFEVDRYDYNGEKLGENILKLGGYFGPTFGKYNKFIVGFESNTVIYNNFLDKHVGLFSISPQYKFGKGRFILDAGINISFAYSNINQANSYHNSIMPNVNFTYEVFKDYLWFYANANGKNILNDYYSILQKNRWVLPVESFKTSSIPFALEGGLKGKGSDKFSYNLFFGYQRNSGLMQFATDVQGRYFAPFYTSSNQYYTGAELLVNTKSFYGNIKVKYSSYSNNPVGYPPLEGSLFASYNYMQRIYIDLNLIYQNRTNQVLFYPNNLDISTYTKLPGFANLSLAIKYKLNTNIMLFVEGNNLLNKNIQYQPFYLNYGININGGLALKF